MENVEMTFEDNIKILKKTLIENIRNSDRIFIVPHIRMDYDAIASATALFEICNNYGKEAYIVTDDSEDSMEASFKIMYKNLKDKYTFITTKELEDLRCDSELLILTDTNKTNLIPVQNTDTFKNIIIIDHHKPDSKTVQTDKKLIDYEISSASEIVYCLLESLNMEIDSDLAHRLLSGIYLDTNRLSRLTRADTLLTVTKLVNYGADLQEVQNLFTISNFENDRKQQNLINGLIDSTKFYTYTTAISMNDSAPDTIYDSDHLAKAADYLLQYSLDAAFVIGFVDREELGEGHKNLVAVKARSKSKKEYTIDISEIMGLFDGGGDKTRAACLIETDNIQGVRDAINYVMRPGITTEQAKEAVKLILYGNSATSKDIEQSSKVLRIELKKDSN